MQPRFYKEMFLKVLYYKRITFVFQCDDSAMVFKGLAYQTDMLYCVLKEASLRLPVARQRRRREISTLRLSHFGWDCTSHILHSPTIW